MPGHRPINDRLALLMPGDASCDFKVMLLLVYHSDNPCVLKWNNVMKSKLPVMWRANAKVWVTPQFSTLWMHEDFAPSVKKNLLEKRLPLTSLLLLDNGSTHPLGL